MGSVFGFLGYAVINLGYAVINFTIFMRQPPGSGSGTNPPADVLRGFSGLWMAFYSAALAILYSVQALRIRARAVSIARRSHTGLVETK
jgi:hypothetical protein